MGDPKIGRGLRVVIMPMPPFRYFLLSNTILPIKCSISRLLTEFAAAKVLSATLSLCSNGSVTCCAITFSHNIVIKKVIKITMLIFFAKHL